MKKEISIVGAGGKMGSWFIKYFSNRKDVILKAYDINSNVLKDSSNLIVEYTIKDCIKGADLVILCVPLKVTPKMIKKCSKLMKPKSILIEISSVKNKSFKELTNIHNPIVPICIHPMFGPGASTLTKFKIIFIPIKDREKEIQIIKKIFPRSQILEIKNVDIHDHIMAIVLGLTHYINIIFTDTLQNENYKELLTFGGTTFRVQSIVSESILNDEPDLIYSLIFENHFFKKELIKFNKIVDDYNQLIKNKNKIKFLENLNNIKDSLQKSQDLDDSYNKMYMFMNILENSKMMA